MAGWRWPHFSPLELACKCPVPGCRGEYWHDPAFLDALGALRAAAGKPLKINSAHRRSVLNLLAGGVPEPRRRRIAVEVSLRRHDRQALLAAVPRCGFAGIGRGRTFLHPGQRKAPATRTCPGAEASWLT